MSSKQQLEVSARELDNSEALEMILADLEQRDMAAFRNTPVEDVITLQQDLKAIDRLRGRIQSLLLTYLETS